MRVPEQFCEGTDLERRRERQHNLQNKPEDNSALCSSGWPRSRHDLF
jgi:hypothetical protein